MYPSQFFLFFETFFICFCVFFYILFSIVIIHLSDTILSDLQETDLKLFWPKCQLILPCLRRELELAPSAPPNHAIPNLTLISKLFIFIKYPNSVSNSIGFYAGIPLECWNSFRSVWKTLMTSLTYSCKYFLVDR